METRIDAKRIIKIQVHYKKPGDYKWYEYQAPVYKQRHPLLEWLIGWLVKPNIVYGGQAEGWCLNQGRYAHWTDDQKLIEYGYEIIEHLGMKMCYRYPMVEIWLSGAKHSITKRFEEDIEMQAWLEQIQEEAGKRLTLV
jgi:hypothetical protein